MLWLRSLKSFKHSAAWMSQFSFDNPLLLIRKCLFFYAAHTVWFQRPWGYQPITFSVDQKMWNVKSFIIIFIFYFLDVKIHMFMEIWKHIIVKEFKNVFVSGVHQKRNMETKMNACQ